MAKLDDDERRAHSRFVTKLKVDIRSDDHFLFAYITNISEMGIFIRSDEPMELGTEVTLGFGGDGPGDVSLELDGVVVWVNPVRLGENLNPGMGVHFPSLTPEQRETLVELIRAIAYLDDQPTS